MERSQIVNDQTSKVLMEARQNTRDQGSAGEAKDKRIRRFMSQHGDYEEGELDGRMLRQGDQDLCAPGLVEQRGEKRFWGRPPENR